MRAPGARARPAGAAPRDHLQPGDLDRLPADRRDRGRPGHGLGGPLARPPRLRPRAARSSSSAAPPATASPRSSSVPAAARPSSTGRCSARPGRLFVNTVPATIRDTSFLGRGVLDYLGPELAPRAVTLEITERQVIENLNLYREAMHSFTDLGFSFAIDDVGAGYSGLETVAALKPDLPQDRHGPRARRPPEEGEPAGREGDPRHGRRPGSHGHRGGDPGSRGGGRAARPRGRAGARATSTHGRWTLTPSSRRSRRAERGLLGRDGRRHERRDAARLVRKGGRR